MSIKILEYMEKNKIIMKDHNMLSSFIYLYVLLPIAIFLLGWCRLYIAIPGVIVLAFCWFRLNKKGNVLNLPKWNIKNIETLVFMFIIVALWVYLSGIGKLVFQNTDHDCRNPIFEILVNYEWPVNKNGRGLMYYIGFWLPSALVGKAFGMNAGFCFQAIWAVMGIMIVYFLISSILGEFRIWPMILFIFFSGIDIVGYYLVNGSFKDLDGIWHLEIWGDNQYSSFTTQLFWVFNQALPTWITVLLIYLQKKNCYIILLMGLLLIEGPLPFIGLIPFVVYFIFSRKYEAASKREWWIAWFKDTFTFENILGGGIAGLIVAAYLFANEAGQLLSTSKEGKDVRGFLMMYVLFIFVEFLCYIFAIYKYQKKNQLLYICTIWLCICPLIKLGHGTDFCMRASIPALLILFIMVMKTWQQTWRKKDWRSFIPITILLLLGSLTPIHEINRTTAMTYYLYHQQQHVYSESQTEDHIFESYNFSGSVDSSLFYKYIGKAKD